MSTPATIVEKVEAYNAADEQDRENIKPKQSSGTILGLESFDDTAFKDEFDKSDETLAKQMDMETFVNNREHWQTHRDYRYSTYNRKYLYLSAMRDKRTISFIGPVVAVRTAGLNTPS